MYRNKSQFDSHLQMTQTHRRTFAAASRRDNFNRESKQKVVLLLAAAAVIGSIGSLAQRIYDLCVANRHNHNGEHRETLVVAAVSKCLGQTYERI